MRGIGWWRRGAAGALLLLTIVFAPHNVQAQAVALPSQPTTSVAPRDLPGIWQGALKVGPSQLRLALKVTAKADGYVATLDSIDQGAKDIPVTSVTKTGDVVAVALLTIGARFDGTMSADGQRLSGHWIQGGQKFPLELERVEKAATLSRPQEPTKPYPYDEREVTFRNDADGVTLAGTLTLPRTPGPHPAVVLISGSGPQDRNETIMGHRPFLVLADHLTRQGIAVLRFDDRGVGQSKGDFRKATHEDFAEDALAGVAYLRSLSEIDREHIGLIGHSEGGVSAPIAAVRSPEDVDFIVLMAGIGVPVRELLVRQTQDIMRVAGAGKSQIDADVADLNRALDVLLAEGANAQTEMKVRGILKEVYARYTPEQRAALGLSDAMMNAQVQLMFSPWFYALLQYDPEPTLAKVKVPVLAVNGEKDVQVASKENLAAINAALRAGGNTDVTTIEFPGLNHLFQQCQTGAIGEYATIEETMNPVVLKQIADWIKSKTGQ